MSSQSLLWIQGFELLVVGMCLVFIFLLLLVLATKLMSWLVGSEEGASVFTPLAKQKAAITAAIHQFRQDKNSDKE